ncbi:MULTISPECIES: hypothetical protein [unclassified Acidisoma]|jgi:hypothetical protein|uniref:hypothetical protein n=1 Tax=unclassified Acidisoma TaxID=2634065 RepID=UPI00131E4B46|nr:MULTISPECIES: hypothetical protein [unclassified Acidisoma]
MAITSGGYAPIVSPVGEVSARESQVTAVAWPAIIAGAFVAAAVTILLVALGSGIGLASVSPWSGSNPSPTTFTVLAAIWLILVNWIAFGLGGYITGRLRTKHVQMHTDEVFFRDTANGFVTWAVASVLAIGFLASGASSIIGTGTHAVATVASGATAAASQTSYLTDTLFRPGQASAAASAGDSRAEAGRILATGLDGDIAPADRTYLAQLVAARTGVSQADAQKRVDAVISTEQAAVQKAKQAANAARKAASALSFFTFFSMLIGAFIACVAAAIGGRQRDAF